MKTKKILEELFCAAPVIPWGFAATKKLIKLPRFQAEIAWFPLISHWPISISYAFPIIMLLAALLITINKTRFIGLVLSAFILLVLTAYLIGVVTLVEKVPCSCSGIWSNMEWRGHIWMNTLFLAINCAAIYLNKKNSALKAHGLNVA